MRSSVFRQRVATRIGVIAAMVGAVGFARQASAQAGGSTTPASVANPFAPDGTKRVPVSKAVFGDAGIIVNARNDGFIEVAAAGPEKTVLLQLRTLAARGWVDSTSRMLRARQRKASPPRTFRSDIQEYGANSTMAVTRSVTAGESAYALVFSDGPGTSFTIPIEESEADVFVAIVRKAVVQSAKMLEKPDTTTRVDSAPPAPKKKKPAVRKPTVPAVQTPAGQTPSTTPSPKPATTKPSPAKPTTPDA